MHPARRGLTLIELLVSLGIIAVLAAIALPALVRLRERSRKIEPLAAMRGLVQAVGSYSTDHRGELPSVGPIYSSDPDRPYLMYFLYYQAWPWHWAEAYLGVEPMSQATSRPIQHDPPLSFSYMYSSTMFSDPSFWDAGVERTERMLRGQLHARVRYPSQKAMFISPLDSATLFPYWRRPEVNQQSGRLWTTTELAFCDGSAGSFREDELHQPDMRGEYMVSAPALNIGVYGRHTVDGLLGRDLK